MKLIAIAITTLALAIFGGSVVLAQALDRPTSTGASTAEKWCQQALGDQGHHEVAACVLKTISGTF